MKEVTYIFFGYHYRLMITFYSKISLCLILLKQKYVVILKHFGGGVCGFLIGKIPKQSTQVVRDCRLTPQSNFHTHGSGSLFPKPAGQHNKGNWLSGLINKIMFHMR